MSKREKKCSSDTIILSHIYRKMWIFISIIDEIKKEYAINAVEKRTHNKRGNQQ